VKKRISLIYLVLFLSLPITVYFSPRTEVFLSTIKSVREPKTSITSTYKTIYPNLASNASVTLKNTFGPWGGEIDDPGSNISSVNDGNWMTHSFARGRGLIHEIIWNFSEIYNLTLLRFRFQYYPYGYDGVGSVSIYNSLDGNEWTLLPIAELEWHGLIAYDYRIRIEWNNTEIIDTYLMKGVPCKYIKFRFSYYWPDFWSEILFYELEAYEVPIYEMDFMPTDDAWVEKSNPNVNHGSDSINCVDGTSGLNRQNETYWKFDISAIPDNMTICETLFNYWTQESNFTYMNDYWIGYYGTFDNWNETTLTWNNKPPYYYQIAKIHFPESGTHHGNQIWKTDKLKNWVVNQYETDKKVSILETIEYFPNCIVKRRIASKEFPNANEHPRIEIKFRKKATPNNISTFGNLLYDIAEIHFSSNVLTDFNVTFESESHETFLTDSQGYRSSKFNSSSWTKIYNNFIGNIIINFHINPQSEEWTGYKIVVNCDGIKTILEYGSDINIVEFEPIQVVFDAALLVAYKPTLIKVDILNSFSQPKTSVLTLECNGQLYSANVELPANQITTVYLPMNNYILPKPGTLTLSVSLDPVPGESDISNNQASGSFTVKETNDMQILYLPICFLGEQPVSYNELMKHAKGSNEFIIGTYPVSPSKFDYDVSPIPIYFIPTVSPLLPLKLFEMCSLLKLTAKLSGHDRAIGVLPTGWFQAHGFGKLKNLLGVSYVKAALVENTYWTATAHELGHTYGLWTRPGPEEYEKYPPYGRGAGGIWVVKRGSSGQRGDYFLRQDCYCFMGAGYVFPESYWLKWICNDCYEDLLATFTSPQKDPEVLYISGIIYENDTVQADRWYRIQNSSTSLNFGSGGNYSIVYLDSMKQEIGTAGFDPIFLCVDNSTGQNITGFAFTMPYLQNTSTIQIRHNNLTIYERVLSPSVPLINVLSPNGGEIYLSGDDCTIEWEGSDPDGDPLTYNVMYSPDNGASWIPLATNITENCYIWNTSYVQSGNNYLIKVIGNDGVNTGEDVSNSTFTIVTHDIAISGISPSITQVYVGQVVNISATVQNDGNFTETFNVTAYADKNTTIIGDEIVIGTQNVILASGNHTTIALIWNTAGVARGNYTISAYAWPVPGETDTIDNTYIDDTVEVLGATDIVITNLTFSKQNPATNETISINVTVENRGDTTETFDVSVNYTRIIDPLIGTQTITLAPGESITLNFTWTPTTSGRYEIKAYTNEIPNDINPADNTKTTYIYVGLSLRHGGGGRTRDLLM